MNSMSEKTMINFFNLISSIFQRTFKFLDPEKYKKVREKLEPFKYIFRVKSRANYDWYPIKNMKFDYAFFFEKCCSKVNITQNERKQRFEIPFI